MGAEEVYQDAAWIRGNQLQGEVRHTGNVFSGVSVMGRPDMFIKLSDA